QSDRISSQAASSHPDFSREPFIIEQYVTTARFENDGTGEQDLRVRVRVQTDAGVAAWSELAFGYNSESENVDVHYARIRGADGRAKQVPVDAARDTIAAAARDFPAYANCKEKHVSVPSLAPGDWLEYEVAKHILAPALPYEFWFEHRFVDTAIVLDERLEI